MKLKASPVFTFTIFITINHVGVKIIVFKKIFYPENVVILN